ncbi:MAG: hypothetical protein CM1200mP4_1780 [Rhodospirillaceae bacterium]|nr:MAG: hypothetical protein CM1200mP4_1780 [Rhodospirillaceae bacterium]
MTPEEVLGVARRERLPAAARRYFPFGDKPELRYRVAQEKLGELGHKSTISYLVEMCQMVRKETGLLPMLTPEFLTRRRFPSCVV